MCCNNCKIVLARRLKAALNVERAGINGCQKGLSVLPRHFYFICVFVCEPLEFVFSTDFRNTRLCQTGGFVCWTWYMCSFLECIALDHHTEKVA